MNQTDSKILDLFRFPLAVLVVAIHCFINIAGWDIDNISQQTLSSNVAVFFMIAITRVIASIAVPVFFIISGYLFFGHLENWNQSVWEKKMSSRFYSLFLPYFIWITLMILQILIFKVGAITMKGAPWTSIPDWVESNGGVLNMYWNCTPYGSPILIPMWFIRDLIVAVLLSPVFFWLLKARKGWSNLISIGTITVLGIAYLLNITTGITGINIKTFFFFGLGAILMLNGISITSFFAKFKYVLPLYLFLLVVEVMNNGTNTQTGKLLNPLFIITGVIVAFNFLTLLIQKSEKNAKLRQWISKLIEMKKYTFFIFAFHALVLMYVKTSVGISIKLLTNATDIYTLSFVDKHPILTILNYLSVITISVLLCIVAQNIMERYLPRTTKVLCGQKIKK